MRGCGGLQQHQERQSCSDLERQNLPVVVNDWHVALVLEGPEGLHLACRDLNWLLEENPTDCFVACWGRQRASVVDILRVRQRKEVLHLDKGDLSRESLEHFYLEGRVNHVELGIKVFNELEIFNEGGQHFVVLIADLNIEL